MKLSFYAVALLTVATTAGTGPTHAAEGMWTLDNLPKAQIQKLYGFTPDDAFVEKIMKGSARLAGGCSGSFVSPDGLVLTNHHCVAGCLSDLSTEQANLLEEGTVVRDRAKERVCPGFEVNRLEEITDVTAKVAKATAGKTGSGFADAKRAVTAKLTSDCVGADKASTRCDLVDLYQGGRQHLYRYHRFDDVRLVFAPESASAFFGGDPDNFNFPRYNLDMSLLRVYEDGKPAQVNHHLPFDPQGADEGELVMVTGHPGSTQRLLAASQLAMQRDHDLPERLFYLAEMRGFLNRFAAESPENARISETDIHGVENSFKALRGRLGALQDQSVFDAKRGTEQQLRSYVAANDAQKAAVGAWDRIDSAMATWRNIGDRYLYVEGRRGFQTDLFAFAQTLVRSADERKLDDAKRLAEFTESSLPRTEQLLLREQPIYPHYEKAKFGWSLTKLREVFGADDPVVRKLLGRESPQQLADRLIDGTQLADAEYREKLWNDPKALAASKDPMIEFARKVDPAARSLRMRYENEVDAVVDQAQESIAQARFAQLGDSVYPDATFSLRLSHGKIAGWKEGERDVPPFTTVKGLYDRATGAAPFALPESWIRHRAALDEDIRINQVSTNDIIGGNSGSPLIDKDGQIVGLIFDGNIHSLGGAFHYDEGMNRAVSVHPAAMLAALRYVYDADSIADELTGKPMK